LPHVTLAVGACGCAPPHWDVSDGRTRRLTWARFVVARMRKPWLSGVTAGPDQRGCSKTASDVAADVPRGAGPHRLARGDGSADNSGANVQACGSFSCLYRSRVGIPQGLQWVWPREWVESTAPWMEAGRGGRRQRDCCFLFWSDEATFQGPWGRWTRHQTRGVVVRSGVSSTAIMGHAGDGLLPRSPRPLGQWMCTWTRRRGGWPRADTLDGVAEARGAWLPCAPCVLGPQDTPNPYGEC